MAFVENELRCNKAGEIRRAVDSLLERPERLVPVMALCAGQCDVGMVGPRLGNETTLRGRGHDAPGERNEFGGRGHIRKENAGALEEAQVGEMDRDGSRMYFGETSDDAPVLFLVCVAQKLESDMPRCGLRPAKAVAIRPEPYHGDL